MRVLPFTLAALVAFSIPVTGQNAHPHIMGEVFIVTAGGDNKVLGRVEVAAYKPEEVEAAFKTVDEEITATQPVMENLSKQAEKVADDAQKELLNELPLDYQQEFLKEEIAEDESMAPVESEAAIQTLEDGALGDKVRALAAEYAKARDNEWQASMADEYTKSTCKYYAHLPTPIGSVKTDSQGKYDLPLPSSAPVVLAAHTTRQAGENTEDYFWIVNCDPSKSDEMTLSNDNLASSGAKESVVKTTGVEWIGERGMPIFEAALAKAKDQAKESEEQARKTLMDRYRANPLSAQNDAIRLYPDLGKAGTPLNKEFTARYKLYKTSKPEFFTDPDWPIRLAKESADATPAK